LDEFINELVGEKNPKILGLVGQQKRIYSFGWFGW